MQQQQQHTHTTISTDWRRRRRRLTAFACIVAPGRDVRFVYGVLIAAYVTDRYGAVGLFICEMYESQSVNPSNPSQTKENETGLLFRKRNSVTFNKPIMSESFFFALFISLSLYRWQRSSWCLHLVSFAFVFTHSGEENVFSLFLSNLTVWQFAH